MWELPIIYDSRVFCFFNVSYYSLRYRMINTRINTYSDTSSEELTELNEVDTTNTVRRRYISITV